MAILQQLGLALLPLLIAVDPPGLVVVYAWLTEGVESAGRRRILRDALLTALLLGVGFMFLGAAVFRALQIDRSDFRIAGGLILLVLSLSDLLRARQQRRGDDFVGVVPLGTPLIVGPAVLTTLTLLQKHYGNPVTLATFVVAIALVAAVLSLARPLTRLVGPASLKASSKIISILLAAFAVHLIRIGITEIVASL
jgi:multiple antibiotic resistance protein